MDCPGAQEWLLQSECPGDGPAPADVAAHLDGCSGCRAFADRLRHLDEAARALPGSAGADASREAFLQRLRSGRAARRPALAVARRWAMASAAAVLLAAGAGALFVALGGSQTSEASGMMDRLVDWNLTIAGADSLADRDRIYAAHAQELERQVRQGRLTPNEQELASSLLDNSARLARDADPLAEAEGFTEVATVLVRQMSRAATKGDVGKTKGLNKYYARVVQRGVNAKIDRLDSAAPAPLERDRKLEKLLQRNAELRDQLASLLATSPAATHEELRRALDIPTPKRRKGR